MCATRILLIASLFFEGAGNEPNADSCAPSRLVFHEGHGYAGAISFEWTGGRLVVAETTVATGPGKPVRHEVVPPPEVWRTFWKTIDSLGVWRWNAEYEDPIRSSQTDGSAWNLELEYRGRHVKSRGYNASPEEYQSFRNALDRVIEDTRRQGREHEPGRFFLGLGFADGGNEQVKWLEDRLVVKKFHSANTTTSREVVPTREAWEAFWDRVNALGVWNWREKCRGSSPQQSPPNPSAFLLELRRGEKYVMAQGEGGCPETFPAFRAALATLVTGGR